MQQDRLKKMLVPVITSCSSSPCIFQGNIFFLFFLSLIYIPSNYKLAREKYIYKKFYVKIHTLPAIFEQDLWLEPKIHLESHILIWLFSETWDIHFCKKRIQILNFAQIYTVCNYKRKMENNLRSSKRWKTRNHLVYNAPQSP